MQEAKNDVNSYENRVQGRPQVFPPIYGTLNKMVLNLTSVADSRPVVKTGLCYLFFYECIIIE